MLYLQRLTIRNFRAVSDVEVQFAGSPQVTCLVGKNGTGKSALTSLLADALRQLVDEAENETPLGKDYSTSEIGPLARACCVRSEWSYSGENFSHVVFLRKHKSAVEFSTKQLLSDLSLPFPGEIQSYSGWLARPRQRDEPMAKAVLVVRPAARYELVNGGPGSEQDQLPMRRAEFDERPFAPGSPLSSLPELHRLLPAIRGASDYWRSLWFQKISDALSALHEREVRVLSANGYFQVTSPDSLDQPAMLSAAEMDVLSTVGQIAAQQVYLARKYNRADDYQEPSGWAFIDDVDLHLHPGWQERIVPLLCKLFPTIHFFLTTQSPFVLRSLPRNKSIVLGLPNGEVFFDDFAALDIESILSIVFDVPSSWSEEIQEELKRLQALAKIPKEHETALRIYRSLSVRSPSLRAACDRTVVLSGTSELVDAIADVKGTQDTTDKRKAR